jgi:hypothetical protein
MMGTVLEILHEKKKKRKESHLYELRGALPTLS